MESAPHLVSFFSPDVIARSLWGLAAMVIKKPLLFATLFAGALRSYRGLVRFLRFPVDLATVRNSKFFDGEWYRAQHPNLAHSKLSPEEHFLLHEVPDGRWASPAFSSDEYQELNPEVRASGINPLAHYEQYGRFTGCPVSFAEAASAKEVFPSGTEEMDILLDEAARCHFRTAVFATHARDGRIAERDILYLRGLGDVCDNIIVVASSPLFPDEPEKLRGIASEIVCRVHSGYDFGSYRIGLEVARNRGWLASDACRELVFANASCYAPVRPFSEMFDAMARRRKAHFWGLTFNSLHSGKPHLQSFFLVFRRPVIEAKALEEFFSERPAQATRSEAINLFELQLTDFLRQRGFMPDAFVRQLFPRLHDFNPMTRPIDMILRHKSPLVKVKALRGETIQPPERILECVGLLNPELAALMRVSTPLQPRTPTPAETLAARNSRILQISEKIKSGKPAKVLFLVSSPSMFPARPLFEEMRKDNAFDARIAVIPDLRWPNRDLIEEMSRCERELGAAYPAALLPPLRPAENGLWPDVLRDFDIAVFSSPYDLSNYRYNPSRLDVAGPLGLHVNYSFSTSVYGYKFWKLLNHAFFWKTFFECDSTAAEYTEHSVLKGANAEVVGYVKMDALATAKPWPRNGNRKRVLIAPHHSVEGGANDTLAFSNFQRYADYFLALPEKHPEIDFVFRPHPFLFTVLSNPSKWGQAKVDDWIARMKAHRNVRWSDEGDYFPAFASCDAIVQDCGSYLAEWFYTGKPCCFMLKKPSDIETKFTPLGKECLSHCYIAYGASEIDAFLHDVVEGGADPKAAARDEFRKTIMVNYPHAADAALRSIKESLGLIG